MQLSFKRINDIWDNRFKFDQVMKILFFNYEYPPLGAGAANATAYILKEYSDLEVDLITSSIDDKYHLEKIGENIRIHRLPIGKNESNLHFQSKKDLLVYFRKAYFFARKLVRLSEKMKKKYDLSHSFFSVPCGFISLLLKWQYDIPYIISLRGSDVPGYSDRFTVLYRFITPIIRLIWKKAAFVVANSQGLKNLALANGTKKPIEIIYNGIDTDRFRPEYSMRPKGNFIITPGASRITARKGLKYLVKAIFKLSSDYPNLILKIMGEGNEEKNLKNFVKELQIENRVEFLGRISSEKTTAFYQEASIFVLPSLNEGMSNAMLEALACGLPILATDTGGTKELLKERENGFVIKMKDSDSIAEKIRLLIDDQDLLMDMGRKSREIAEKMSWKNVARQYIELYEKTV